MPLDLGPSISFPVKLRSVAGSVSLVLPHDGALELVVALTMCVVDHQAEPEFHLDRREHTKYSAAYCSHSAISFRGKPTTFLNGHIKVNFLNCSIGD